MARSRAIRRASTFLAGLPSFLPFARAFLSPAFTRSAISERSSSATAPKTVNTIFPVGVEVSICSERETNSIPRDLKVSSARSRWDTERAKRSNSPPQITRVSSKDCRHQVTTQGSRYFRLKYLTASASFSICSFSEFQWIVRPVQRAILARCVVVVE